MLFHLAPIKWRATEQQDIESSEIQQIILTHDAQSQSVENVVTEISIESTNSTESGDKS